MELDAMMDAKPALTNRIFTDVEDQKFNRLIIKENESKYGAD